VLVADVAFVTAVTPAILTAVPVTFNVGATRFRIFASELWIKVSLSRN